MDSTRLKWILGLGLVFVLLLATNLVDRTNFRWMGESVATIYEDRLVAKGLVYDMRSILADKQLALASGDVAYLTGGRAEDSIEMQGLLDAFGQTKLTHHEEGELESLQRHYRSLEELEVQLSEGEGPLNAEDQARLRSAHDAVVADLYDLSRIQLEEGRRELNAASRTMGTIDVLTKIEVVLLIAIGFVVGLLILYRPRASAGET